MVLEYKMKGLSLLSIKKVLRIILCYRDGMLQSESYEMRTLESHHFHLNPSSFACQLHGLLQILNSVFSPSSSGKWRVEGIGLW